MRKYRNLESGEKTFLFLVAGITVSVIIYGAVNGWSVKKTTFVNPALTSASAKTTSTTAPVLRVNSPRPPNIDGHALHRCNPIVRNGGNYSFCYWNLILEPAKAPFSVSFANFFDSNLTNLLVTDYIHCDLTNAVVPSSPYGISGYDFEGSNLAGVDLAGNGGNGVNFLGTKLATANLKFSSFTRVFGPPASLPRGWFIEGGALLGPYVSFPTSSMAGTNFEGRNLSYADFNFVNLAGVALRGADLYGVTSENIAGKPRSLPTDWKLRNGVLIGPGANLSEVNDFFPSKLGQRMNFSGLDLVGTTFRGSNRNGPLASQFVRASFDSSNFAGDDLRGVVFINCSFRRANLTNADFRGANLSGSDLNGATISGANLRDSNLSGVRATSLVGQPASLPPGYRIRNGVLKKY